MKLEICFGLLADSISKQVSSQLGSQIKLPYFDEDAKAIARLYIRGLITDSEKERARRKLIKKIIAHLLQNEK